MIKISIKKISRVMGGLDTPCNGVFINGRMLFIYAKKAQPKSGLNNYTVSFIFVPVTKNYHGMSYTSNGYKKISFGV